MGDVRVSFEELIFVGLCLLRLFVKGSCIQILLDFKPGPVAEVRGAIVRGNLRTDGTQSGIESESSERRQLMDGLFRATVFDGTGLFPLLPALGFYNVNVRFRHDYHPLLAQSASNA